MGSRLERQEFAAVGPGEIVHSLICCACGAGPIHKKDVGQELRPKDIIMLQKMVDVRLQLVRGGRRGWFCGQDCQQRPGWPLWGLRTL